jgi:hypothetical protein
MIPPYRSSLETASIEAGECIRSWVGGGLFIGDYYEYLSPDKLQEEGGRLQEITPFG